MYLSRESREFVLTAPYTHRSQNTRIFGFPLLNSFFSEKGGIKTGFIGGATTGTGLPPPPHGGPKNVGKHQKIYTIKGSMMPTSNFRKVWPLEQKIQYGRQSLGLVTLTCFLREIIRKFFFFIEFSYPGNSEQ